MQLKMLLQKASNIDWSAYDSGDLKEVSSRLVAWSKSRLNSKKTVKQYEEELTKLINKLYDHGINSIDVVQFYQPPQAYRAELEKFIIPVSGKKDVIELQERGESHETHFLSNPPYIRSVENQPPPVEENKLLKYWDNNIIPRILEFVKTTLKQLEIDEFFEQMRIPLRKNDQNEATKIAYVICDNKLPPGAILPEPGHDWSTLSTEEVSIGQFVLLKLPATISESTTPLLQPKSPEELCLVQIVFIDQRSNNLLVRHRIPSYSVLHYFWTSITSVFPVQTPVKFMSLQDIFKNAEECLQGLISGYAKQVLTKMSEVVEIDVIELVK